MVKVDKFSGQTYFETDHHKIGSHGNTFSKMEDSWVSNKGEVIQKQGKAWLNTKTGVSSDWGDPFQEDEDE